MANSQVGVHLGYVSRQGYTLVDSQLFMPDDEWFDEAHTDRRKACGVLTDLTYHTKPEIGLELLQAAVKRNEQLEKPLRFEWVTADNCTVIRSLFVMGCRRFGQMVLH